MHSVSCMMKTYPLLSADRHQVKRFLVARQPGDLLDLLVAKSTDGDGTESQACRQETHVLRGMPGLHMDVSRCPVSVLRANRHRSSETRFSVRGQGKTYDIAIRDYTCMPMAVIGFDSCGAEDGDQEHGFVLAIAVAPLDGLGRRSRVQAEGEFWRGDRCG